jgi:hypothetical protein
LKFSIIAASVPSTMLSTAAVIPPFNSSTYVYYYCRYCPSATRIQSQLPLAFPSIQTDPLFMKLNKGVLIEILTKICEMWIIFQLQLLLKFQPTERKLFLAMQTNTCTIFMVGKLYGHKPEKV